MSSNDCFSFNFYSVKGKPFIVSLILSGIEKMILIRDPMASLFSKYLCDHLRLYITFNFSIKLFSVF